MLTKIRDSIGGHRKRGILRCGLVAIGVVTGSLSISLPRVEEAPVQAAPPIRSALADPMRVVALYEEWRAMRLADERTHGPGARRVAKSSLFERIYSAEKRRERAGSAGVTLVASAMADDPASLADLFSELVSEGERIFFHETFSGNGRTCGTCHPAENNFTLDAELIASDRSARSQTSCA